MSVSRMRIEKISAATWVMVVGAIFGGITLLGLFAFAFVAGTQQPQFICSSFELLAGVFAFGAALSASFLGGGAAAKGTSAPGGPITFAFAAGGGIAVLLIAFFAFNMFRPKSCDIERSNQAAVADAFVQQTENAIKRVLAVERMIEPLKSDLKTAYTNASNAKDSGASTCSNHASDAMKIILTAEDKVNAVEVEVSRAISLFQQNQTELSPIY
jgi:hypothetical protein